MCMIAKQHTPEYNERDKNFGLETKITTLYPSKRLLYIRFVVVAFQSEKEDF